MRIVTNERADALIDERGGKVWVWLDPHRGMVGSYVWLEAHCEPSRASRETTRKGTRRLEASWNGCVLAGPDVRAPQG